MTEYTEYDTMRINCWIRLSEKAYFRFVKLSLKYQLTWDKLLSYVLEYSNVDNIEQFLDEHIKEDE